MLRTGPMQISSTNIHPQLKNNELFYTCLLYKVVFPDQGVRGKLGCSRTSLGVPARIVEK